jgi:hypothetical protein
MTEDSQASDVLRACVRIAYTDDIVVGCPRCGTRPLVTFLRGTVVRPKRAWYWPFKARPQYAVICRGCKEIVGYEWSKVRDVLGTSHLFRGATLKFWEDV